MKTKIITSIAILFFLCLHIAGQQNKTSFSGGKKSKNPTIQSLEKDIPELMKKSDVPGMSFALIQNGKLVWSKGFGVKNAETKEPVTNETVFEAASLSKPVFAYAVLKLADEGKFDLDRPLNEYLGNNYDVGDDERLNNITARRVLSHTTGFPNWRNRDSKTLPIYFTPGERFSYSGEGFEYLRVVIENVTKMPFDEFMKQKVFVPLKMNSSSYVWQEKYKDLHAYRHDSLGILAGRNENFEVNAAASLQTTAEDYARFVIAVLNGEGLKKQTLRQMIMPQIMVDEKCTNCTARPVEKLSTEIGWGLGSGLEIVGGETFIWHWGDNGNGKAYFTASTKTKDGVVFFANGATGLAFLREIILDSIGGKHPAIKWLGYERYDSPARNVLKAILNDGAEKVLKDFDSLKEKPDEGQMNQLGYTLLRLKKVDDAIAVFIQNTIDYPKSANVWDSLGEAYMKKGEKDLAIKNYEKSLELNPENKNAAEILKKLKEQ